MAALIRPRLSAAATLWRHASVPLTGCPNMPLTDTSICKAKPRVKPRKLYDSRGLYLEIAASGTKAWRFKYRFAGREKRISIGICPEVSLKLARQRRDEARALLARDIAPSAYRKAQK